MLYAIERDYVIFIELIYFLKNASLLSKTTSNNKFRILNIRREYASWAYGQHVNIRLGLSEDDRLGFRMLFAASQPDTILAAASAFEITSLLKGHEVASTDWNQCQKLKYVSYSLLSIAAIEGHDQLM